MNFTSLKQDKEQIMNEDNIAYDVRFGGCFKWDRDNRNDAILDADKMRTQYPTLEIKVEKVDTSCEDRPVLETIMIQEGEQLED
jgi:hypothetical protein